MTVPQAASKAGHGLAKVLGIKLQEKEPIQEDLSRGESIFSLQTQDTFVEQQPRSWEWVVDLLPSRRDIIEYIISLFPFLNWIGHYNLQWLVGDSVAGMYYLFNIPTQASTSTCTHVFVYT